VGVLELIRSDLESLVDEVIRMARDSGANVPIASERVWKIVRENGERRPTLEREIHKEYDTFLISDPTRLQTLPSFTKIQRRIDADAALRKGFLIPDAVSVRPEDISLEYMIPVMNRILLGIDSGQSQQAATALVLSRLDEYLTSKTCKCRVIAPLLNFTTTAVNIEIQDGIHLRKFTDEDLEDHCRAATLFVDFAYLHRLSSIGFHLETAFEQDRKTGFGMAAGGQYQRRLEDTLTALRLLHAGAVGFGFIKYEQEALFGKRMGWTTNDGSHGYLHGNPYDLREQDLKDLRDIRRNLKHVEQDHRFAIALVRLMGAYSKPFGGERLIDYWIALESLMMPDAEGELSYRVSLRTARLVADAPDRGRAYDFLRTSYSERSKFVHGSKASVDAQKVRATEDYLRRVLLHCVKSHKVPSGPELDSLVLGERNYESQ
jgi:hypothetical protein